jgi:hypothetical protein
VPSLALPHIYNKRQVASKERPLWESLRKNKDFEAASMEHLVKAANLALSFFSVLETNIKKLCFFEKNL